MKTKLLLIVLVTGLLAGCKKEDKKPEEEPNYTNFKILTVKITAMPFLDANTTSWDPFDGPDVFFKMESSSRAVLYDGSASRFKDVGVNELPLAWDFVNAYQITNLGVTHFVMVYDYDTLDPNDWIGEVGFTLSEHKTGYPKTITKTSGQLTITITGEWY
jgi:hypothetical protein